MNVNKAIIAGRLGSKPDLKALPSGVAVANFSVATSHRYTDKEGKKQETTTWHDIVVYGRMAETAAQYLDKGQVVFVIGRIHKDHYERKDGTAAIYTKIIAEELQFGPRPQGAQAPQAQQQEQAQDEQAPAAPVQVEYPDDDIDPDDIPF